MLSSETNTLLTHTLASFWRKQSCFCWYVTYRVTSALVSKSQLSIRHICLILKLALYKCHIIIIIIISLRSQIVVSVNFLGNIEKSITTCRRP